MPPVDSLALTNERLTCVRATDPAEAHEYAKSKTKGNGKRVDRYIRIGNGNYGVKSSSART
jgi:hypothetical protein